MKIVFLGDIVARIGRQAVIAAIPKIKEKYNPDIIIANGENMSHGSGISLKNYNELRDAGIDFFTSGNHIFRRKDIYPILDDSSEVLIRPANYPARSPGVGVKEVTLAKNRLLVINLQGQVFMNDHVASPYETIDSILAEYKDQEYSGIIIDFHAEATSEKMTFMHYVDGRVSAVFGTHTHVPTADEHITSQKTAYITDVGACCAKDSVIGVGKELMIKRALEQTPTSFDYPEKGECAINGVYLELEDGKAKCFERIQELIRIV